MVQEPPSRYFDSLLESASGWSGFQVYWNTTKQLTFDLAFVRMSSIADTLPMICLQPFCNDCSAHIIAKWPASWGEGWHSQCQESETYKQNCNFYGKVLHQSHDTELDSDQQTKQGQPESLQIPQQCKRSNPRCWNELGGILPIIANHLFLRINRKTESVKIVTVTCTWLAVSEASEPSSIPSH